MSITASVIIPTYNRADLLSLTLRALVRQASSTPGWEAIVVDDGSKDNTREIVASFSDILPLTYIFQEDQGYRVARARNLGANLARGDVFIFLDSGVLSAPSFISAHLEIHDGQDVAAIGYVYGYDTTSISSPIDERQFINPGATIDLLAQSGASPDMREHAYAALGDDLRNIPAPWAFFWTANVSVTKRSFFRAGGFDEDFKSWGVEDIEFAYRLHLQGTPFLLAREAAALEYPHWRDQDANNASHRNNVVRFHAKHPTPIVELFTVSSPFRINREYNELVHALSVRRAAAEPRLSARAHSKSVKRRTKGSPTKRIAYFGCLDVPMLRWEEESIVFEPDGDLVASWTLVGINVRHSFGIRTLYPDRYFDSAFVSQTLDLLPDWYVQLVVAEATRVAARVHWTNESISSKR